MQDARDAVIDVRLSTPRMIGSALHDPALHDAIPECGKVRGLEKLRAALAERRIHHRAAEEEEGHAHRVIVRRADPARQRIMLDHVEDFLVTERATAGNLRAHRTSTLTMFGKCSRINSSSDFPFSGYEARRPAHIAHPSTP